MATRKRARPSVTSRSRRAQLSLDALRLLPHTAPFLDSYSFSRLATTCREVAGDPWLVGSGRPQPALSLEGLDAQGGEATATCRHWRQSHFTGAPGSTEILWQRLRRVDWGRLQSFQLWLPTPELAEPVQLLCQALSHLPNLTSFRLRGRAAPLSDSSVGPLVHSLRADQNNLPLLSTLGLHAARLDGERVVDDLCVLAVERRQTLQRLELRESVLQRNMWQRIAASLRWTSLALEVGSEAVHTSLLEQQQALPRTPTLALEWYNKGMADYVEEVWHSQGTMRAGALDALGAFALQEGGAGRRLVDRALAAIQRCLSSADPERDGQMRIAALTVIGRVADEGHGRAVRMIADSLEDPLLEVRLSAIDNLKVTAFPDDEASIESICSRLPHSRDEVRLAARAALAGLLAKTRLFSGPMSLEKSLEEDIFAACKVREQRAHRLILSAAAKHLTHTTGEEVFLEYADQDPRHALDVLTSSLADPSTAPALRRVTHRILQTFAAKTGQQKEAESEVQSLLRHYDPAVKVSSLEMLRASQPDGTQALEMLSSLCDTLKDADAHVRAAAVQTIVSVVRRIGARSLDIFVAVAECLQDESELVRGAAVEGLPSLTGSFDKYGFGMTTLVNGLSNSRSQVREAFLAAIVGCAKERDKHTIARLTDRLSPTWPDYVRMVAAAALVSIAPRQGPADPGIADSLAEMAFGGASPQLHESAVNSLVALSQHGAGYTEFVVSALAKKLEHRDAQKRVIAALKKVPLIRGQPTTIRCICDHISSPSAAQAILAVANPGDGCAVGALADRLASHSSQARWAAVQAFRLISTPEVIPEIVGSVSRHLTSARPEVREAAVGALAHSAPKGEPAVVHAVSNLLENDNEKIRHDGVKALKSLVEKNDHKSIAIVMSRLTSSSSETRKAATSAIKQLATKGDTATISALASLLEHPDGKARRSAMVALLAICEPGDPTATALLLKLTSHDLHEVRLLILQGLKSIVRAGDQVARSRVLPLLQDGEVRVRHAAQQVLEVLSGKNSQTGSGSSAPPEATARSSSRRAPARTRGPAAASPAPATPEVIDLS